MPNDIVGHRTIAQQVAENDRGRTLSRWEASEYWIDRALASYREHPLRFAILHLGKLGLVFAQAAQGQPEEYRAWRWRRPALSIALFDFGFVLALGVFGMAAARAEMFNDDAVRFMRLAIPAYTFALVLFFVTERYRIPLIVLLLPFAGHGLARVIDAAQTRSWRRLGIAIPIVFMLYGSTLLLNRLNHAGPVGRRIRPSLSPRKTGARIWLAGRHS